MSYEQYAYTKYNREVKKLPKPVREKVVEVQEKIAKDPLRGKPLRGELKGWRTYPFSYAGSSYRIAYKIEEETERVIFGSVGTREGFYEDLKNS